MKAKTFLHTLAGTLALLALTGLTAAADGLTNRFGFSGPEIFPVENQIGMVHAADLNGNGLNDLVLVNNVRGRITILYNQTGQTNVAPTRPSAKREVNELPPDARFRIESIPSEKRIGGLIVADLNSDGRPDIAYYGEPKELLVIYNQGDGEWSAPKRWLIEDGQLSPNGFTSGDVNGDGRTDLVLLAENHFYLILQNADGTLGEAEKHPLGALVRSVQVLDLNADGRDDLLFVTFDSATPVRFRLQQEDGQLGPEIYFRRPPLHSYWGDFLEGTKQAFLATVTRDSGRAQISKFTRQPAEPLAGEFKQGQFQVWPLAKTDKTKRGLVWADVNGDGRTDLLVAEPERGQLSFYEQKADGTLAQPRVFPTLAGVSEIAVADWNGDGRAEIFLLSADERQVGVTRLDENGRLPFPELLPLDGRPLALTVGAARAGENPLLAMIVLGSNDRRQLVTRTATGKTETQTLSENFKSNPATMLFHDINQNGRADLVVLIPYEKVKVLVQAEDGTFNEHDVAPPGGTVDQPWLSVADVDGDGKPELLLAQKNFLRAVVLRAEESGATTNPPTWAFQVKEQINGAASNSRLVGATPVHAGTNAIPALFLLDAERRALTVCERDAAGVWQVVRNLALPVTDFNSLQAVAWGGGPPNSVAFIGANAVAWLPLAGEVWELTVLDSYETPVRDGFLNDVFTGDVNNDGRKELIFTETAKHHLDVVQFDVNHKLSPGDRWQVFEQKTFRGRGAGIPEPREVLVTDVTGDGKEDVIVVVHDRILVYPQE
jgi:hypothetical protein